MAKIKIGIVGCGGIANGKHFPALKNFTAGHACVPPQDPALVFPLGNSRYFPSPTGCLRRRMVPEQVIYPPFSPAGRCVLPFAAPCKFFPIDKAYHFC